jgi:hypothetical protein
VSINGNHFSDDGVELFFRNLKHNHWLLGLNLANNDISEDCLKKVLLPSLAANNVLHTLVMAGNPGYSAALAHKLKHYTDNCECRFDVLEPESLQSLLFRWSLLQDHEAHGAGVEVTVKQVTTHADLHSTSAWKEGRTGASVDSAAAVAAFDRRTYADEPRPRWTCNAKGFKPPTVIVGAKKAKPDATSGAGPDVSSSVTHEGLLAASLRRSGDKSAIRAGASGKSKTKGKKSRTRSSDSADSLDDDYWRCRSFAESSVAASLEADDARGGRGVSRYEGHYNHYGAGHGSSSARGGGSFNLEEVLEEVEQQQQDAREDVLAGALPSGTSEFHLADDVDQRGQASPSGWAGDQDMLFSPTRMFAADAMLGLKGVSLERYVVLCRWLLQAGLPYLCCMLTSRAF